MRASFCNIQIIERSEHQSESKGVSKIEMLFDFDPSTSLWDLSINLY
jgi:hypothetical protein